MQNDEPIDGRKMQIASDRDQEIKLIAKRAGLSPERAGALLDETGSFAKAMERCGVTETPESHPKRHFPE
jgi:hypothetical protein